MFPKIKSSKKNIYLDYAATTPLDGRVKKAMAPFWSGKFGNPSSLYKQGREAKEAIEDARLRIAEIIGARPSEIIFTAGGTESVNLAIRGVAKSSSHIITTAIEHHSVLRTCEALQQQGLKVTYAPVDSDGFASINEIKKAVRPETILISVMYANNEIGTIEPIAQIGKWLKNLNAERARQNLPRIIFHIDACQAAGSLDLNVDRLGVDLMSVNGSKIYGPKQTGFLYKRGGVKINPLIYGGGQERDLRSGTENVPGVVGLAEALDIANSTRVKQSVSLVMLRDYFIKELFKKIPKIILNGSQQVRLANNINISIPGVEGEALMLYLDSYNISVSTGSACATSSTDPSHVLLAIGRSKQDASSSIRFTLGKATTKKDLSYVLKVLPGVVGELRQLKITP